MQTRDDFALSHDEMRTNGSCNGVSDLDASHIQLRIRFDCENTDAALAVASNFNLVNDTRQPKDLAEPRGGDDEERPALPDIQGGDEASQEAEVDPHRLPGGNHDFAHGAVVEQHDCVVRAGVHEVDVAIGTGSRGTRPH